MNMTATCPEVVGFRDWPATDDATAHAMLRSDRERLARDFDAIFGGNEARDAFAASDAFIRRLDAMIVEGLA